jgi:hypothetical protein
MPPAPTGLPDRLPIAWNATVAVDSQLLWAPWPAANDQLVALPDGDRVDLRAAADGRLIRTVQAPGEEFGSVWMADNVLIAQIGFPGSGQYSAVGAFDITTGHQLWQSPVSTGPLTDTPQLSNEIFVTGRSVVLLPMATSQIGSRQMWGLDLRTGRVLWSYRVPMDRCGDLPAVAAGSTIAVLTCPGQTSHLLAIDPQDGKIRWQQQFASAWDVTGTSKDFIFGSSSGDILAGAGARFSVFTPSGQEALSGTLKYPCYLRCGLITGGDGVVVAVHSVSSSGLSLRAYGLADRRLWWQGNLPEIAWPQRLTSAGGLLYLPTDLLDGGPTFVTVVDPGRGSHRDLPLPVSGSVVGAAGKLLVVRASAAGGGLRYVVLRPQRLGIRPAQLGGSAQGDWPDACTLLTRHDLSLLGHAYTPVPGSQASTIYGVQLPHSAECQYISTTGNVAQPFTVRVAWISQDPASTQFLLTSDLPSPNLSFGHPPSAIGDGGYLVANLGNGSTDAFVGVGRIVVKINASRAASLVRRVASLLLARLHRMTPSVRAPRVGTVWIDQGQAPLSDATPTYKPVDVSLSGDSSYSLQNMTWSVWSGTEAVGTGTAGIEDCTSCAFGHGYQVPVKAVFSHPVRDCTAQHGQGTTVLGARYWWSQVDLTYPSGLPSVLSGANRPYGLWAFTGLIAEANQSCTG